MVADLQRIPGIGRSLIERAMYSFFCPRPALVGIVAKNMITVMSRLSQARSRFPKILPENEVRRA
jgi:adenine-specific DNA glycosylase